jgi:hypothetical protein
MKTAAPGYTRRRPPNEHSRSHWKYSTTRRWVEVSRWKGAT